MTAHSQSALEIRRLDEQWVGRWDDFIAECPEATFFHRAGWQRVIEASFGHHCHFLLAESGGRIRGVLPLTHVRSRLFGNALISSAFCVYGGPATSDLEAREALDEAAVKLASALDVDYLEYRLRSPGRSDWPCNADLYATFRKPLQDDAAQNLLAIPRKQRAMVRKGIKVGLRSEWDGDVDRFYRLYAESVRDLGTPVFSKTYFRTLKKVFGSDCAVLSVTKGGRAISSVLSFYFRDEVLPYYGGAAGEARDVAAYDFMYWELMRDACERGYRVFDFGRSKRNTGAYAFKKHWGFEPAPLHYAYKLLRRKDLPSINPLNPKYRLFIAGWKRLPLPVANRVGPYVARMLG